MLALYFAILVLTIWLWLALVHAGFWRIEEGPALVEPRELPDVVVVIPARNEEVGIGETLRSLWEQDYRGRQRVVLVDDHSEDRTVEVARQAAEIMGRTADLTIIEAEPLPDGWTGKVWAMQQGLSRGVSDDDAARYALFSDADISHGKSALRELVARAETDDCDLASFMVRLHCETPSERLTIPAFVFFFRLLYPFRRVNDPANALAGAAGGTMLVRRTALERIGGLECIRGELIDDCALARHIKQGGHRIRLDLSETSVSTRCYGRMCEITDMIARTAYTQLRYSPLLLLGCVLGLCVTFLAPVVLVVSVRGWPSFLGGAAWLIMSLLYLPMVRFYRQSPLWAGLLPITALLYLGATITSAWRHYRGRGGQWKGRSRS